VIKYLGSKRRLLPALVSLATSVGARTAVDLFSGTARVAKGFKEAGLYVTAVDSATYAHVLAQTYVATDGRAIEAGELAEAIIRLNGLVGRRGYVTEVFCERARYFHPANGARIDAVRDEIEAQYAGGPLYPLLLTSLLEAADRVDSTTGVQMAYLKSWAPRALRPMELRPPGLVAGEGRAVLGDAVTLAGQLGRADLAYFDPPYNQHRYFTNYHVWETIVRWDAPAHYGVACKRLDCRSDKTVSAFNRRREIAGALAATLRAVEAEVLAVSYNDESWLAPSEVVELCGDALLARERNEAWSVAVLGFDQARYVGAQIGIHNPAGVRVGSVSHLRNTELVIVGGPAGLVDRAVDAFPEAAHLGAQVTGSGRSPIRRP
jgi:adenine-specific DNA-methyltransferase